MTAQDSLRPFGPYELVRRLANGAVAEVWLARARSVAGFEKTVALKMIHARLESEPGLAQLLIDEARLTSMLSHRNITQVIDLGHVDGRHYIAMEYVDGMDLARVLKRLRDKKIHLSPRVSAFIVREVAEGLEHTHRRNDAEGEPMGIVHRDVSPANILVSFDGEVKLSDFGLARSTSRKQATQAGVIKGKYAYMSPEQARSQPVDARADIFSAAAVLYELLTGTAPYPDAALPVLMERVTRGVIDPPERHRGDIPDALLAVLRRGLAPDAAQRYPNARAFADALNAWLYTQTPSPEMELARVLESAMEGARNAVGPLGALIVEDNSDEITDIEAHKKIRQRIREETGEIEAPPPDPEPEPEPEARTVFEPVDVEALQRMAAAMSSQRAPAPSQRPEAPPPAAPRAPAPQAFSPPPPAAREPEVEVSDGVSSTVMFDGVMPGLLPPAGPGPMGPPMPAPGAMPTMSNGALWGAATSPQHPPVAPAPAATSPRGAVWLVVAGIVALASAALMIGVLLRGR